MSPLIEIFSRVPKIEKKFEIDLPLITHKKKTDRGEVSLKYKHHKHRKSVTVEVKGINGIPTTNVNVSYIKRTSKANVSRTDKMMKVTLSEREVNYLKQV